MMKEVWITRPRCVELLSVETPIPGRGEALMRHTLSAISPGSELLAYRGDVPASDPSDTELDPHAPRSDFPVRTGYSAVGVIESVGDSVDSSLVGQRIFSMQPHRDYSIVRPEQLITLPDNLSDEQATLIPNLETATSLVMDASPGIGERVVVLGQGVVGLLVTNLLARFPLGALITVDRIPERRRQSIEMGAQQAFDPETDRDRILEILRESGKPSGADLVVELTGVPSVLNDAIAFAGFGGRVIIGSWYGRRTAPVDLGGRFHRNRISLVSSQVSSIAPQHSARWTSSRRMRLVLNLLPTISRDALPAKRFPIERAGDAYATLDKGSREALQVILTSSETVDQE
jgi:2-desacetyl-2-hydroxyethyl bacteriochlorophyllide A dehydrogenase